VTWGNRARLLLGLLLVLAIVAAGTLLFTQRQHRAVSTTATVVAESFPVGTDYGGIVTRQYVDVGDDVLAGDALFDIHSLDLRRDIASGYVVDPAVIAGVGEDGTMSVVATVDGTIASVAVPQGGFAQSGGVIASLDRAGSLFVEARFVLDAREYARLTEGAEAEIVLPDEDTLRGSVGHIDVETIDGRAMLTVRIDSDKLTDAQATGLFQPGTPVAVRVDLRDDGLLAGVADALHDLLRKIGL
jgi:multidrug resistance efflux pump